LTQKKSKGLVQLFTGNGKGKTTAALGEVLRAAGHGLSIHVIFFMKGSYPYGEFSTLTKLPNVKFTSFGLREFTDPNNPKPEEIEQARLALAAASDAIFSGKHDMVVLDEVNVALKYQLIELDEVVNLINEKPAGVELILTGRYADPKVIAAADLVTEMTKIKHPFDHGIRARKGIEY